MFFRFSNLKIMLQKNRLLCFYMVWVSIKNISNVWEVGR